MKFMEQKTLQIKISKKNKMTERDVFEKYDNLGKNELNSKSNKMN